MLLSTAAAFLVAADVLAVLLTTVVAFLTAGAGAAFAGAMLFLGAACVFDCFKGDFEVDLPAGLALGAGAAALAGTLAAGLAGALT